MTTPETKIYYSRKEAAQYLSLRGIPTTQKTLAKLASRGGGPAYRLFGPKRALYTIQDLDNWSDGKMSKPMKHTSEYDGR